MSTSNPSLTDSEKGYHSDLDFLQEKTCLWQIYPLSTPDKIFLDQCSIKNPHKKKKKSRYNSVHRISELYQKSIWIISNMWEQ